MWQQVQSLVYRALNWLKKIDADADNRVDNAEALNDGTYSKTAQQVYEHIEDRTDLEFINVTESEGTYYFNYKAGRIRNDNTITIVSADSIAITDDDTNYIEIDENGTITSNQTGFTSGKIPLYICVMSSGSETVTDKRTRLIIDNGIDIATEDVSFETLGSPTYTTLKHWLNLNSAGFITSSGITDNEDGTCTVGTGTGVIKITDSDYGEVKFFDWEENDNVSLTNNNTNWIYVNYNTETEAITVASTTDVSSLNLHTQIVIGRVYRDDNDLFILNGLGQDIDDYMTESCYKDFEVHGVERATGFILTEDGTRYLDLTSGVAYCAHNRFSISALNTNTGGDTFTYVYRDSGDGWTFDDNSGSGYTQVSNTLYDDDDGTPGNVDNNKYATYYVYCNFNESGVSNQLYIQMGQVSNNDLHDAESEQPPTPPALLRDMCLFVGKIIIEKGATNFTEIQTPFVTSFVGSATQIHNELGGLDGGTSGEYYHLTAAQAALVSNITSWAIKTDNYTASSGDGVFVDTSSKAITITLPSSPSIGNTIVVADAKDNAATYNITIARNSSNINGNAGDFIVDINSVSVTLVYMDATEGWRILNV